MRGRKIGTGAARLPLVDTVVVVDAKLCSYAIHHLSEIVDHIIKMTKQSFRGEAEMKMETATPEKPDITPARIRSSYLEWCKLYKKEVDESWFPIFESNFISMETYANESRTKIRLNQFFDCTEEEYIERTSGKGMG
jgi:hypothetical protein